MCSVLQYVWRLRQMQWLYCSHMFTRLLCTHIVCPQEYYNNPATTRPCRTDKRIVLPFPQCCIQLDGIVEITPANPPPAPHVRAAYCMILLVYFYIVPTVDGISTVCAKKYNERLSAQICAGVSSTQSVSVVLLHVARVRQQYSTLRPPPALSRPAPRTP